MSEMDRLFTAAKTAMENAYAKYSDFPVGAAILTKDGQIFSGANIEIISFPEGWCAETTALSHYVMGGGGQITDICVIAEKKDICTPCGGCRQRLAEFAPPDAKVHLCTMDGIVETVTMAELLPHGFDTDVLSKRN